MKPSETGRSSSRRKLLGGLALLLCTQPAWAIFGVWRRAARRTVILGAATTAAVAGESAAASQQAAAAASAANASAAAAQQAAAAADQAEARASQTKTPEQRLKELQSLYDQGLISASDYETAKQKILVQLTQ